MQKFHLQFCGAVLAATVVFAPNRASAADELTGRAVLPAATFSPGPTSGTLIGSAPINGQQPPFLNKQPVQGFSAIHNNGDGTYWVMSDNGYGSLENSADFELRVHLIRPNFKTAQGGAGTVEVLSNITLSDPDKRIPWAITNFFSTTRNLTGADFDIESMQKAPDGTLWFGDEFGPFLLHTDATGKLLEAPISLPDFENVGKEIRSPQNPKHEEASAVRIMNALRAHAQSKGNNKAPVFSPWDPMLDDGDPTTGIDNRQAPPVGSGLSPASSELFNVASIKSAGYPVVVYTVNDPARMQQLLALGVNGLISDRPDLLYQALQQFNGGAYLLPNGLVDKTKFDAQGHRGGRDLRPENTLPAFEAALDNLMSTIETDMGIAANGVPMLEHDPAVESLTCRRTNGAPYVVANEVFIKDLTSAQIQSQFICDKVFRGQQQNNLALSPVSVQFATSKVLPSPYVMPTAQNLLDFVKFYSRYYRFGAGAGTPNAEKRWQNADAVRFNMETKTNPRTDIDPIKGIPFADRTTAPVPFVDAVLGVLNSRLNTAYAGRVDIQSFDFRTLLLVHEKAPSIRTVALIGDFPKFADTTLPGTDDSTNLQPGVGAQAGNTPWLAGLPWPYRITTQANAFRAERSGGFEGMALTSDGTKLLPLLERPLAGFAPLNTLVIHEFDLASKSYTGTRYYYPLDVRGTNIGDFIMFNPTHGLIIEREGSQGNLGGFKAIFEVTLNTPGTNVTKRLAVDLLNISDPNLISLPGSAGDVGIGNPFAFPFTTIEDVLFFDSTTIGVLNDNNFPFSLGRHLGTGAADDNEFIIIKLGTPIGN